MRILSMILAASFLLAGVTMAGSIEGSLPGVGAFSYSGPPIQGTPVSALSRSMIVAAR